MSQSPSQPGAFRTRARAVKPMTRGAAVLDEKLRLLLLFRYALIWRKPE
jgi:hypothetical protein